MNIVLSGPGRSGTTLFSKLFSFHDDFAWISGWVNKYPNQPWLSAFNSVYQNQLFGVNWADIKLSPKPAEAYVFWNYFFYPFTNQNLKPDQDQVKKCTKTIDKIKIYSKKKNFVTKITGDTRYNILKQVFKDDITYLWIERDPRVVVSSYIKQKWGYKNKPEEFSKLTTEDKIKLNVERYLKFYEYSREIDKKILFYEDLCKEPVAFFEKLFFDLGIHLSSKQFEIISAWNIEPVGWESHYKQKYTAVEQNLFNTLLEKPLKAYNYI